MLNFLKKSRQARFLLIGIFFTVLGFILQSQNITYSSIVFYIAIIFLGYYSAKEVVESFKEDKKLNVDLLMLLSVVGSIIINYESEGALLLFIFAGAEVLESYVKSKSSKSIEELMKQVPNEANLLLENGSTEKVLTKDLKISDRVLVAKGDQIPIDGVIDRQATINEASLTGESVPVTKDTGEEVFAGTINAGDSFIIEVTKEEKDTVFSSIIRMVESAQNNPSMKQSIIDKIQNKYVIGVLIAVPIFVLALVYIGNYSFQDAFYRGLVLLTVASPCALKASATPATLSAISNGAKNGILFKDARAMEIFDSINLIATDKTGTLTYGDFEVVDYKIDDDILKKVVYMEQSSNHPIAKGIVSNFKDLDLSKIDKNEVEEIPGIGLKMDDIVVGNLSKSGDYNDPNDYLDIENKGNTLSHVAVGNEIVGYIELADKVRETSKDAIRNFKNEGIEFDMLTGDKDLVAKNISAKLGITKYHANLLPADKMKYIEEVKQEDKLVAMIGDGINDAPALANADIGISMGSGTSIAMESSDLVIVKNDLNKLFHSYKLSSKLNKIIYQNIVFSIAVIIILATLNIIGILDLPSGVVFHEGSTILVILNGLRLLGFKLK